MLAKIEAPNHSFSGCLEPSVQLWRSMGNASRNGQSNCPTGVVLLVVVAWGCLIALSLVAQGALAQQAIQFSNVTRSAGIHFTHFKGNEGIAINLEEFGPAVCVADFDGDG